MRRPHLASPWQGEGFTAQLSCFDTDSLDTPLLTKDQKQVPEAGVGGGICCLTNNNHGVMGPRAVWQYYRFGNSATYAACS